MTWPWENFEFSAAGKRRAPARYNEIMDDDCEAMRRSMVDRQLRARGIRDAGVLNAMETVPRHEFVPPDERLRAYDDCPLAIGLGQTISQPYVVGYMTELLEVGPDH